MPQPVTHAKVAPDLTRPAGIKSELARLKSMVQGKYPCVSLNLDSGTGADYISIYHDLCASSGTGSIGQAGGKTFAEMIANAEIAIRNWKATRHDSVIRKMALAIIELTDSHCECTETLLRGKGFSGADITEYRDRACERASEMAGAAPFEVLP